MKKIITLCFIVISLMSLTNCSIKSNVPTGVTNEESNTKVYQAVDGWTITYPVSWNKVEENYIQEESTGKTIEFYTKSCTKEELEKWIKSEINRKLETEESQNTLEKELKSEHIGDLTLYSYTIKSKVESSENLLMNKIFFDGSKRYEFRTQFPLVTEMEFEQIINSFKIVK